MQEIDTDKESNSTMYNTNLTSIEKEIAEIKKDRKVQSRKDCYSMIKDVRTRNPFMKKFGKSADFSPE